MELLDLTLDSPVANIALDEALLEAAEAGESRETLRLWEPGAPLVVVGRSSKAAEEVRLDYCREQGIPVLRRASGGAAIVTGPGCLMYAVVLSLEARPHLLSLDAMHRFVLETITAELASLAPALGRHGTSDLALTTPFGPPKKVSGNSLRLKRRHVLYHGTLLYNFPLEYVAACLDFAPRQPEYRSGRGHQDFVANLPLSAEQLKSSLIRAWRADRPRTDWPRSGVETISASKYLSPEWTIQV